ncbi:MAG: hypothetical protein AB8F74_10960 [Saprospiraceae bacterium]
MAYLLSALYFNIWWCFWRGADEDELVDIIDGGLEGKGWVANIYNLREITVG